MAKILLLIQTAGIWILIKVRIDDNYFDAILVGMVVFGVLLAVSSFFWFAGRRFVGFVIFSLLSASVIEGAYILNFFASGVDGVTQAWFWVIGPPVVLLVILNLVNVILLMNGRKA
jgi:hypothetical protein